MSLVPFPHPTTCHLLIFPYDHLDSPTSPIPPKLIAATSGLGRSIPLESIIYILTDSLHIDRIGTRTRLYRH